MRAVSQSIESSALSAIRRRKRWIIHSVFKHAVNLIGGAESLRSPGSRADWLSIVDTPLRGPDRLHVTASIDWRNSGLKQGDTVHHDNRSLWLGRVELLINETTEYALLYPSMPSASARAQRPSLRQLLLNTIKESSPHEMSRFDLALEDIAKELRLAFQKRPRRFSERCASLIGLGHGTTPSGDDFLSGLLAGLDFSGAGDLSKELVEGLPDPAGLTTHIGARQLLQAYQGRHLEAMAQLLLGDSPEKVREAAQQIVGIGASSGRDLLRGVLLALDCLSFQR